jgi:predicted PurR-regulated permease PerM
VHATVIDPRDDDNRPGDAGRPGTEGERPPAEPTVSVRSAALGIIAGVVVLHTLVVGRTVLLPVVLASFTAFVLGPLVQGLRRLGLPRPLGAAVVIVVGLSGVAVGIGQLVEPAVDWMERAPQSLSEIERKLRVLKKPIEQMSETTKRVEDAALVGPEPPQTVAVEQPSLATTLVTQAQGLLATGIAVTILTYFLLASGQTLYRRLAMPFRHLEDRKRTVRIAKAIESQVSRYLVTLTVINAVLGLVVGGALLLLGVPNPFLWGVMTGVLNFVPYLGALTSTAIVTIVALLSFSDPWQALLVPLTVLAISSFEGMIVTPIVAGQRLLLHPIAILGAIFLWTFLWGVPGSLVAVPLVVVFKIVCDHVPALRRVGRLLAV